MKMTFDLNMKSEMDYVQQVTQVSLDIMLHCNGSKKMSCYMRTMPIDGEWSISTLTVRLKVSTSKAFSSVLTPNTYQ